MGASWALPGALAAEILKPKAKALPALSSDRRAQALCGLCPAGCLLSLRIVDGKAVGVRGAVGHPVCEGGLCPKGSAVLQELYHPDRLQAPLHRVGPKGSVDFKEVSWDEAGQVLAQALASGRGHGMDAVLSPANDERSSVLAQVSRAMGGRAWRQDWPASQPPLEAFASAHGTRGAFYDLARAACVVSFGWDWLQSWPSPVEAQRAFAALRTGPRRAQLIQVEARLSVTGAKSDEWISVLPGGEEAAALAVARVLLDEKLYDAKAAQASGFAAFKAFVGRHSREEWAAQAGTPVADLTALARRMAAGGPTLALSCRREPSLQAAVHSLNILLGSIGRPGGVLALDAQASSPASAPDVEGLHAAMDGKGAAAVLWLDRVNPMFQSPLRESWAKTLAAAPFVVCSSSFRDETSRYADLLLPPLHAFESWQGVNSVLLDGSPVSSASAPIIKAGGAAVEAVDLLLAAARRRPGGAGLPDTLADSVKSRFARELAGVGHLKGRAPSVRALPTSFPVALLAAPVAKTGGALRLHIQFPLSLSYGEGAQFPYLGGLGAAHLGAQWGTWAEIHPETAARLGIDDGAQVELFRAGASIKAVARHYEGIGRDAVSVPFGLGRTGAGRFAQAVGGDPGRLSGGWSNGSFRQGVEVGIRVL